MDKFIVISNDICDDNIVIDSQVGMQPDILPYPDLTNRILIPVSSIEYIDYKSSECNYITYFLKKGTNLPSIYIDGFNCSVIVEAFKTPDLAQRKVNNLIDNYVRCENC